MARNGPIRIDFICPKNAGRSQMAAALAERERRRRGLEDEVEIHSAGTRPADHVHEAVVEAMAEVDLDVSDRSPSFVVVDDLEESHFVITMGCTVTEFNPEHYGVESRTWDLENPEGKDAETVREIRDDVERRVTALFDEIEDVEASADEVEERTTGSLPSRVIDTVRSVLGSNEE